MAAHGGMYAELFAYSDFVEKIATGEFGKGAFHAFPRLRPSRLLGVIRKLKCVLYGIGQVTTRIGFQRIRDLGYIRCGDRVNRSLIDPMILRHCLDGGRQIQ